MDLGICLDYCLVLLFGWLGFALHCLPLIPSNPSLSLRRTSQPEALLHLIGGGSAETPTAQPALRHSYTALGSAVGTPLGRAHRVVLPSGGAEVVEATGSVGPLSGGAPTELGGGCGRGKGGFEGLQGEAQGIGV